MDYKLDNQEKINNFESYNKRNRFFDLTKTILKKIGLDDLRFVSALAFVFIMKVFFINLNIIPSSSMNPNILEGDIVLVNKTAFWDNNIPERGQIITFDHKVDGNEIYYVKRAIGFPGDKIQFKQGGVILNGEIYSYENYDEPLVDNKQLELSRKVDFESLRENDSYNVIYAKTLPSKYRKQIDGIINTEVFTVPEGMYFVVGDNRHFSKDSRMYGFIDHKDLIGTPVVVLFNYKYFTNKFMNLFGKGEDSKEWNSRFLKEL